MGSYLPTYDWEEKYQRARMVSDALGRPIIYMTRDKRYYDEKGNQVTLFDEWGEPTELGTKAIVLPVKPKVADES